MLHKAHRRSLPAERSSITHRFDIAGHTGYVIVGLYPDGLPGEMFLVMNKEGSVISGLLDCFAIQTSLSFQYGVPLAVMVEKFKHTRFEPYGITTNSAIAQTTSIMDYIFRWLELRFGSDPVADDADVSMDAQMQIPSNVDLQERHNAKVRLARDSGDE